MLNVVLMRLRLVLLAVLLGAGLAPSSAWAISLMDPLNIAQAVDQNVVKLGDGVPFGDLPRLKLDVYAPQNPSGDAPVVMFIYGGAWSRGERGEYEFAGRALAARGFVAVVPDYRVVPAARYPDFLYDNAKAVKWIEDNIARYGGDANRLFLAGHSAGAYNAVMLGLDSSFLRDMGATVKIRGVAGLAGPYDFYPFEFGEVTQAFGDAPNPQGTQPINLVTADAPPMFLATGTSDPIVRPRNTGVLAAKLKQAGIWVTEKYYDGIGHMEAVTSMGAMLRWRAPVLDDMVFFFSSFGAFPSGQPRVAVVPEPAAGVEEPVAGVTESMQDIAKQMDALLSPLSQ